MYCSCVFPPSLLTLVSLYWFSSVTVPGHCFSQNSHRCITKDFKLPSTYNKLVRNQTARDFFGSIFPLSLKSSLESYSATQVAEGNLCSPPGPWWPWVMTRPSSLSVYFLFLALQDYNPPVHYTCSSSSRKRARGAQRPPPLFLDQTGAQTAEKIFFETGSPSYHRVSMTVPLPPYMKVWTHHCISFHGYSVAVLSFGSIKYLAGVFNSRYVKKIWLCRLHSRLIDFWKGLFIIDWWSFGF